MLLLDIITRLIILFSFIYIIKVFIKDLKNGTIKEFIKDIMEQ